MLYKVALPRETGARDLIFFVSSGDNTAET